MSPPSFSRTTSAEDENVSALRARVMNNSILQRQRRNTVVGRAATINMTAARQAMRAASMPAAVMREVTGVPPPSPLLAVLLADLSAASLLAEKELMT